MAMTFTWRLLDIFIEKKQKGIGEDRESGENCDSRFGDGCLHESFPKVLTLIS